MVEVIPKHIKDVWDQWNIRGSVILSLTLQAILICFSPLRKRTPTRLLIILIWSSYLLADWAANFSVGLISKNQGKVLKPDDPPQDKKLMALWAPFLLLHLGGPDTITAFALEDNALWPRHVFGFVFQAIAGAYVVVMSLPNTLWVIILLVFISGTIKYLERTIALHDASLDNFRESMSRPPYPGTDYAKLMEQYLAKKEAGLPTKIIRTEGSDELNRPKNGELPKFSAQRRKLTHLEIAQYAYKTFKSRVVNVIFSLREREERLEIFGNLADSDEALRIIEIELGFLYDALFTKTPVLQTFTGTVSRIVASATLVAAFILFDKRPKKDIHFHGADVVVTYTLFAVGIGLDFISILLFLFSDWTCVALTSFKEKPVKELTSWREKVFNWLLGQRKLRWTRQVCHHKCTTNSKKPCTFSWTKKKDALVEECSKHHHVLTTNFFLRRWCGSINVFNFIAYATKAKVNRIHDGRCTIHRYSWNMIAFLFEKLNFIIQEVFGWIFKLINDVHRWISHKINALSRNHPLARCTIHPLYFEFISCIPHFIKYVWDVFSEFFDISDALDLVHKTLSVHGEPMTKELWEFMFQELKYKSTYGDIPGYAKMISLSRGDWTLKDNLPRDSEREKLVRYVTDVDYDQSLLIWHIATELCYQQEEQEEEITIPWGTDESHHYSYREFSKIISDYMMYLLILQPSLMSEVAGIGKIRFRDTLAEATKFFQRRCIDNKRSVREATINIMGVKSEIEPMDVKGVRSKSILFDASKLAKDLIVMEKIHGIDKWKILSKLWVELLCYAASRCDAAEHVKQLSRGGELINIVWFLMAHSGLSNQFHINIGDVSPKLVVGK